MKRYNTKTFLLAICLLGLNMLNSTAQEKKQPDSVIVSSFFPISARYLLDTNEIKDVKKLSIDIEVLTDIPEGYHYCISPINAAFNGKSFHTGLATHTNGIPVNLKNAKDTIFGQGAVFTRWSEIDLQTMKTSGYIETDKKSYGSIRNKASWNKGKYRITLNKSGYINGKAIPTRNLNWKEDYPITVYEHSWVTMTVENLDTHKNWVIGSFAFPGKRLDMRSKINIFLEQYVPAINYGAKNRDLGMTTIYYEDIPNIQLVINNFTIDG